MDHDLDDSSAVSVEVVNRTPKTARVTLYWWCHDPYMALIETGRAANSIGPRERTAIIFSVPRNFSDLSRLCSRVTVSVEQATFADGTAWRADGQPP